MRQTIKKILDGPQTAEAEQFFVNICMVVVGFICGPLLLPGMRTVLNLFIILSILAAWYGGNKMEQARRSNLDPDNWEVYLRDL